MARQRRFALLLLAALSAIPGVATARGGGRGIGEGVQVRPSGLVPQYPAAARCPEIASPFGSRTRYDGSARDAAEFGGYHGGIDLSLAEGTPLLAVAAGSVVSKGTGGNREGNFLWLRHAPQDTGRTDWVYTKYQHLREVPALNVGDRVTVGQVIAHSGATGTGGGHYGAGGYPHLHLTAASGATGEESVGRRGEARGISLIDPLEIFDGAGPRPDGTRRSVPIPYLGPDGAPSPAGTRTVWPVACAAR